ncbi:synaptobrevin, partial [Thalassiosira pseudonana CCMP1335]
MILYALVARAKDGAVLVESMVAGVEGNFAQISVEVLERIVWQHNGQASHADLDYYFHLCRGDGVICLCISDDTDVRFHAVNYDFLDDVKSKLTSSYSQASIAKAKAYSMDKKFNKELGKLIYFYNENRLKMVRQDKVQQLLGEVDDLRGVLGRNISMILQRGNRLEDLVVQSEEMMNDTKVFTKRSSQLKKQVQRQYYKYYIIAGIVGIVVIIWVVSGLS